MQSIVDLRSFFFAKCNEISINPIEEIVPIQQDNSIYSAMNDLRYRYPYNMALNNSLAEHFNNLIANIITFNRKKIISVDLDNTLWSGVAGDEKATISSDYPQNTHLLLQEALVILRNRGFILTITSKNEESTVKATFEELESKMPLKYSDFSYIAASWFDKSTSIKKIADHFNVDVSSVVHIDDSLFECNEIRSELPKNLIIHFKPLEINKLVSFLLTSSQFLSMSTDVITVEQRQQQLDTYKQLIGEDMNSKNKFNYLKSLSIDLRIDTGENINSIDRVYQLSSKTNQFLNHDIRPSLREITTKKANHCLYSISYRDSISFEEICGVIVFEQIDDTSIVITHFTLSCRFFSRGIEYVTLKLLCDKLKLSHIYVDLCRLKRNNKFIQFVESVSDLNSDISLPSVNPLRYKLNIDKILSNALKYHQIYTSHK